MEVAEWVLTLAMVIPGGVSGDAGHMPPAPLFPVARVVLSPFRLAELYRVLGIALQQSPDAPEWPGVGAAFPQQSAAAEEESTA